MAKDKCPDILGVCETFLSSSVSDDQLALDGFDLLRKDRCDVQDKSGGGVAYIIARDLNVGGDLKSKFLTLKRFGLNLNFQTQSPFLSAQPTVLPTQHPNGSIYSRKSYR